MLYGQHGELEYYGMGNDLCTKDANFFPLKLFKFEY